METDIQSATQNNTPNSPVKDKDGRTYRDNNEKMMYTMRRRRNSPLPHWPTKD